jgi:hypothetical protein
VLVEVEEWRQWIEHHLSPRGAIAGAREAVRPRVKKRDPSGAAFRCGRLRRENERLRMEREILKKTLRIFSEAPR